MNELISERLAEVIMLQGMRDYFQQRQVNDQIYEKRKEQQVLSRVCRLTSCRVDKTDKVINWNSKQETT